MSDEAIKATNEESREEEFSPQLNGKKLSWQKLRRNDSLEMESGKFSGRKVHGSKVGLHFCLPPDKIKTRDIYN